MMVQDTPQCDTWVVLIRLAELSYHLPRAWPSSAQTCLAVLSFSIFGIESSNTGGVLFYLMSSSQNSRTYTCPATGTGENNFPWETWSQCVQYSVIYISYISYIYCIYHIYFPQKTEWGVCFFGARAQVLTTWRVSIQCVFLGCV